jgi:nucleotide-binding universal stress UspA family protein
MIPDIKKILYTTDLSQNSARAFRYAIYFSKKFDAEIIILHVIGELSEDARIVLEAYIDRERRKAFSAKRESQAIERINKRLKIFCDRELADDPKCAEKIASIEVCKGYPEEEILKKADQFNCDAIIMGAHEKGLTHTFLGSVAKRVLRRSRKPVFIIPLPTGDTDISFHDM